MCGVACVHTVRSNQMSRGASGSISLNSYSNVFVLFIVSRASSGYISERLDGSTPFQFTMPQCPDSLNCRPGWTSSSTVTCGPLLVSPRDGAHPTLLGYSLLLCLGWVCRWHSLPFQERAESQQGALSTQDQEHKAM